MTIAHPQITHPKPQCCLTACFDAESIYRESECLFWFISLRLDYEMAVNSPSDGMLVTLHFGHTFPPMSSNHTVLADLQCRHFLGLGATEEVNLFAQSRQIPSWRPMKSWPAKFSLSTGLIPFVSGYSATTWSMVSLSHGCITACFLPCGSLM